MVEMGWPELTMAFLAGAVAVLQLPPDAQKVVGSWGIPAWFTVLTFIVTRRMSVFGGDVAATQGPAGTPAQPALSRDEALAAARVKQQEKLAEDAKEAQRKAEERNKEKRAQQLRDAAANRTGQFRPPKPPSYMPLGNVTELPAYRPSPRNFG